ncbi:MAG TPA: hypothetical protein PLJ78_12700 [Anaerolineae bacterium]|nr:hypothetical protein [Anaerolineae bacterium]HQK14790.1 hypothetical protein [Anaerolineae bacterium]
MNLKHHLRILSVLIVIAALLLSACGGGSKAPAESTTVVESGSTSTEKATEAAEETTTEKTVEPAEPAEPTATPEPKDQFPDILVVHPDAFNFEVTVATNTYVYVVPMMVADTVAYLETEMKAIGWEELGKPTVMGHLATLNLKREGYRLTISMQDNERTQTTRVQMLLMKQ